MLKIVLVGWFYGFGVGGLLMGNYQFMMDCLSCGFYCVYMYVDLFFELVGEVQGSVLVMIVCLILDEGVMVLGGVFFNGVIN